MRLPDLDWPAGLFTDVIMLPSETIVVLSAATHTTPTLLPELVNSWIGSGAISESQWPVPMFDSEQISL